MQFRKEQRGRGGEVSASRAADAYTQDRRAGQAGQARGWHSSSIQDDLFQSGRVMSAMPAMGRRRGECGWMRGQADGQAGARGAAWPSAYTVIRCSRCIRSNWWARCGLVGTLVSTAGLWRGCGGPVAGLWRPVAGRGSGSVSRGDRSPRQCVAFFGRITGLRRACLGPASGLPKAQGVSPPSACVCCRSPARGG